MISRILRWSHWPLTLSGVPPLSDMTRCPSCDLATLYGTVDFKKRTLSSVARTQSSEPCLGALLGRESLCVRDSAWGRFSISLKMDGTTRQGRVGGLQELRVTPGQQPARRCGPQSNHQQPDWTWAKIVSRSPRWEVSLANSLHVRSRPENPVELYLDFWPK